MENGLQQLLDEREIINVVNGIFMESDRRNWQAVSEAFAVEVLLDYSSMGAAAEKLKPAEIVARWKDLLPGFKMTQHAITNHRVSLNSNDAECFSYGNALHYLPNDSGEEIWRVVGYYEHHLIKTAQGWKVDRMKFTATLIDGNKDLPTMAMEAVKTKGVNNSGV